MLTEETGRLASALAGRYRLERELGQGGMATVHLADDLKHDRRVAMKVLRPELAAVIGAERFLAEIKTTANLQHPHILPLFDSGVADSFLFYVMPFIEGESLRDRLNREKQLPLPDAVRIATEVASALDYAHRHNVIHRDIKPENILLHDGRALVADFGIALAASKAGGTRMTETGMSLGTPLYMSPEQAMGEREITARSDVYALGCVLYEMLLGEPPFTGPTAQAIVAKVMTESPRLLTSQRHTIPPHVEAAVLTALEKLPADRWASAAQFAEALANPGATQSSRTLARPAPSGLQNRWRRAAIGAVPVAVAAAGLGLWGWLRPPPARHVIRYTMGLPPEQAMQRGALGVDIAISPDGTKLVYLGPGEGGGQLWIRERDRLDATPLPGTNGGFNPFFSPDGRQIGFSNGVYNELKVVPVSGGPPVTLAEAGLGSGGGGTWGSDGWIYFDSPAGYLRVRASGGTPELIVPIDTAGREVGLAWPAALPNGRGLLLRSRRNLSNDEFEIVALDLKSRQRHSVAKGLLARYVAPGYLVILRADGTLVAVPFDQDRMALTGPATPIVEGVMTKPFGSADIAISGDGTLMYAPGGSNGGAGVAEVVWVGRDGSEKRLDPPMTVNPSTAYGMALSPDGTRLALDVLSQKSIDIWVKQLPSGPFSRLTFEGSTNTRPSWTSDGKSVVYLSDRGGRPSVWRQRADGSGPAEHLPTGTTRDIRQAVLSRDGQWLVYMGIGDSSRDVYAVRTTGDTTPVPLLTSRFNEVAPALSPDGRWLAYTSDESGQQEVYVRPFPNTGQARWQVSIGGGGSVRWARSGRELYYQTGANQMMAVPVAGGATFSPGQPRKLFDPSIQLFPANVVPYYDVSPDDSRFLMVKLAGGNQTEGGGQLVVVENWFEELRQKVKAGQP